jgi:hypothetical protein
VASRRLFPVGVENFGFAPAPDRSPAAADGRLEVFSAVRVRAGHVGESCGEEAVGPLFGEASGVAEEAEGLPLDVLRRRRRRPHRDDGAPPHPRVDERDGIHLRCQIELEGGLDACDNRVLNHRQRLTLHNRIGVYSEPLDLVSERLTSRE